MFNPVALRISCFALSAAALIACKPSPATMKASYADANVAEIQRLFGCDAPSGSSIEACRLLQSFAAAASFTNWPTSGVDAWVGTKYCKEGPDTTGVAALYLRPGTGKMLGGIETPDGARVLAYGGQYSIVAAGNMADWRGPLAAVKEGRAPAFQNDNERANWTLISKPPTAEGFHSLVKTDGASFQNWSTGQKIYARASGGLLLIVEYYQGKDAPNKPCVAELGKLK